MKKSQASLELILLVSFLLLIFIGIFYVTKQKTEETKEELIDKSAEDLQKSIQDEIDIARTVADGYQRTFVVPETLGQEDFEISLVEDEELVVRVGGEDHVVFVEDDVVGNVQKGTNLIQKIDGIVYLKGIDIFVGGNYLFKDSSGINQAVFNGDGSINIRGELHDKEPLLEQQAGVDEFVIRNSAGQIILLIILEHSDPTKKGHMYIKGNFDDQQPEIFRDEVVDVVRFIDENGDIAIKIEENGNMFIKNFLVENGNP
tara:strand:- start:1035 stop:1811 length:777 start_codon:yes stop_codon:yes gene_type:complete